MRIEQETESGITVLTPMERTLDASVAEDLKNALLDVVQRGENRFVLDLSNVEFLDSSGLGAMVSAIKALGGNGDMAVCDIREPVMSVFALTRLDRVFTITKTRKEALGKLLEGKKGPDQ